MMVMMRPQRFSYLSDRERSDRLGDPGEGMWPIERPVPLTPTLSPWERGRTEHVAIALSNDGWTHR
jgi:hypothetical protein